jgi:arsenite transporter
MYLLAIAFFGGNARYAGLMSGLSLVGCARCIAMVLVWNDLSGGDAEYCAAVVALNSLLTLALYSPYAIFFIDTLPREMGFFSNSVSVYFEDVAANVAIYMGIPFFLGVSVYLVLTKLKGQEWYFSQFTPKIGPITLFSLLFTIIILFASKSRSIFSDLPMVIYAAVPLLIYFLITYTIAFFSAFYLGADYPHAVTIAFTAASNNFELALAIAISSFTLQSDEALMSVIGALIEIPTMLALVNACFFLKRVLYSKEDTNSVVRVSLPSLV